MRKKLKISEIDPRPASECRAGKDDETIESYADSMADGTKFPDVIVFEDQDEGKLWLADGYHRMMARKRLDKTVIHAEVKTGGWFEAFKYAAGANGKHGLRLTTADKHKIASIALNDQSIRKFSNREIAKICGVSHAFINKVRPENTIGNGFQCSSLENKEYRVTSDGRMYPASRQTQANNPLNASEFDGIPMGMIKHNDETLEQAIRRDPQRHTSDEKLAGRYQAPEWYVQRLWATLFPGVLKKRIEMGLSRPETIVVNEQEDAPGDTSSITAPVAPHVLPHSNSEAPIQEPLSQVSQSPAYKNSPASHNAPRTSLRPDLPARRPVYATVEDAPHFTEKKRSPQITEEFEKICAAMSEFQTGRDRFYELYIMPELIHLCPGQLGFFISQCREAGDDIDELLSGDRERLREYTDDCIQRFNEIQADLDRRFGNNLMIPVDEPAAPKTPEVPSVQRTPEAPPTSETQKNKTVAQSPQIDQADCDLDDQEDARELDNTFFDCVAYLNPNDPAKIGNEKVPIDDLFDFIEQPAVIQKLKSGGRVMLRLAVAE